MVWSMHTQLHCWGLPPSGMRSGEEAGAVGPLMQVIANIKELAYPLWMGMKVDLPAFTAETFDSAMSYHVIQPLSTQN